MFIVNRVENLSLADRKVLQSTEVCVAYNSDVDVVMRLLKEAALAQSPRVLADPEPAVALLAFGADGLQFKVSYWIADPENGTENLRSLINLQILATLRAHQIEIPFPQRVVYNRNEGVPNHASARPL
jgi:small-conductance mechanosensitive channel